MKGARGTLRGFFFTVLCVLKDFLFWPLWLRPERLTRTQQCPSIRALPERCTTCPRFIPARSFTHVFNRDEPLLNALIKRTLNLAYVRVDDDRVHT